MLFVRHTHCERAAAAQYIAEESHWHGPRRGPPSPRVVLSEFVPIPIGTLSNQVILAGHQHFIVLYLDSRGERLWGDGLAEIGLSDE